MPSSSHRHRFKSLPISLLRPLLILSAALLILSLLLLLPSSSPPPSAAVADPPTSPRHLLFGIASSARSWPRRKDYLRIWWRPGVTRGAVFLDSLPSLPPSPLDNLTLPQILVSADASRFPYTFKGGLRSAVRVSRIVKELVSAASAGEIDSNHVRWIVLGDDDTVFFLDNLAGVLERYDWRQWYYVGGRSESVMQNVKHFFDMAYGGGGFAVSFPLAKALAEVLDSCLMRYGHLYGSDARVYACVAELGVGLTHEPGFHQVDLRGDLFGMLSGHPLTPPVSLHHLDMVDPLFPDNDRTTALKHLFEAVNVDPGRLLQQTVCYDHLKSRTVSVSWGYAVQVYEGNRLLTDLLSLQESFVPFRRSRDISSGLYLFNTRVFPRDPCKRPAVFFFESIFSAKNGIRSNYSRHVSQNCLLSMSLEKNLLQVAVHSKKLNTEIGQVLRRPCCDVLPSSSKVVLDVSIRTCKAGELIAMNE